MREVVRDPAKTFRCPRCGAPVTYKGRGRRPVWCSARCRVEASIERRGNEIVGIKPEVVKVVSPTARLSDWEKERRQEIERDFDRDAIVAMVASRPELLMRVLARIEEQGLSAPAGDRQILSDAMIRTARSVSPETVDQATTSTRRSHKRDASEWSPSSTSSPCSSPPGCSITAICGPSTIPCGTWSTTTSSAWTARSTERAPPTRVTQMPPKRCCAA